MLGLEVTEAVGVAVDATLVNAPMMHVDVETRGEFTRGETVANRRNEFERNVLRHLIESLDGSVHRVGPLGQMLPAGGDPLLGGRVFAVVAGHIEVLEMQYDILPPRLPG